MIDGSRKIFGKFQLLSSFQTVMRNAVINPICKKKQNIVDFCSICIHLDKILRLKYFSVRKKRLQRYDLSLPKRASLRVKIATSIVV